MTTDRFTPQDAAYAAGLSVRRLTHLGKHPDIKLDADSDRVDGKVRRYSVADIVALALLDAARNAGWTPRRSRALLAQRSTLPTLLAALQSEALAGDVRIGALDLAALIHGIKTRLAEIRRWHSRNTL